MRSRNFDIERDQHTLTLATHRACGARRRPQYESVQREILAAFEAGIQHFRKNFPGFTPNVPAYLLHPRLTSPEPIRAAVDATWPAALCFTRARLFCAESADPDARFVGAANAQEFPDRFGYCEGLRVAEEAGGQYGLPTLSRMPQEKAKATLTASIDRLIRKAGGCQQPDPANARSGSRPLRVRSTS